MERLTFPITKADAKKNGISFSSDKNKNAIFPSRLRKLRKEKGVSQDALSKTLGVSKSTVGLWETGNTLPDAKSIYDMAHYYGVSTEYILCRTNDNNITEDTELSAVCEYTRLSNAAATVLYRCLEKPYGKEYLKAINSLIEDERAVPLLLELSKYISCKQETE